MSHRALKARLVNVAWRAFRPGSAGQKLVRALAYLGIGLALVIAVSFRI
jgi:hypothetical protein